MNEKNENPIVTKGMAHLLSESYNTPKTSLLTFHFEPTDFKTVGERLKTTDIQHISIEDKDLYLIDNYFTEEEGKNFRQFTKDRKFERAIYAVQESKEKGEEPARAMGNKEKWELFSHPPQAIQEIYKFLCTFAKKLDADISTLPWELCDQYICAPAVATNRIEKLTLESQEKGKHEDYNTEEGIAFGIPILYSKDKKEHERNFVNGAVGKPWLISLMLYVTDDNFKPEYGLGTAFYNDNGQLAKRTDSLQMRFVIFEGNIVHSIEKSHIPEGIKTWRVSYVYKLIVNPKKNNQSMKSLFKEQLQLYKS